MSLFNKLIKKSTQMTGNLLGNQATSNVQKGTDQLVDGMDLFRKAAEQKRNIPFEQVKGNLFEYIEAAKFNRNAGMSGSSTRAYVTEALGKPHDAADIILGNDGKVLTRVQAKFSSSANAAADSVFMQKDDKYAGMQRLIRKDNHYLDQKTGKETTLLKKSQELAGKRAGTKGNIYQEQYRDVYNNLTDELTDGKTTSGGTTLEEVKDAYRDPYKYSMNMEAQQVYVEMKSTAANMAKGSLVTAGIASGITNMFEVFSSQKGLSEAVADVGADAVEAGIRGGATGTLSAAIRYKGIKSGSALLSDSTASTVMAGGLVDGGVALYEYALGEISADELKDELLETTAKAMATIYYTKAVEAIAGKTVTPMLPIAVYTAANYVFMTTKEILTNAKLNAEEYDRLAGIALEEAKSIREYEMELKSMLSYQELRQRQMFNDFLEDMNDATAGALSYEDTINSIVQFANRAGIELKHVEFEDFRAAMASKNAFRLE